jgi:hypothetical protein
MNKFRKHRQNKRLVRAICREMKLEPVCTVAGHPDPKALISHLAAKGLAAGFQASDPLHLYVVVRRVLAP